MKNIVMVVAFGVFSQLLVATEIEIANYSGWIMDAQAILSFNGKQSGGKYLSNIANDSMVKYNSGIYKITGFYIKLKKLGIDQKFSQWKDGFMEPWPSLGVINRSARFTMASETQGLVRPDKAKAESIKVNFEQYSKNK